MDKKEAFDFYKLIRGEEISWLNLHRQYSQQYLTLISAIFAISLGALYQFKNAPLLVVAVILGPLLNILLCITAIKMCNRFYQRFLEGVTIQAKIEPLLGLNNPREEKQEDAALYPFPDDKYYLPDRWRESRNQKASLDFVNDHMKSGSNKYVQLSFGLLLVANIVLFIFCIVLYLLQLEPSICSNCKFEFSSILVTGAILTLLRKVGGYRLFNFFNAVGNTGHFFRNSKFPPLPKCVRALFHHIAYQGLIKHWFEVIGIFLGVIGTLGLIYLC